MALVGGGKIIAKAYYSYGIFSGERSIPLNTTGRSQAEKRESADSLLSTSYHYFPGTNMCNGHE